MGTHLRVQTREARKELRSLIERAEAGEVIEIIDGRRRGTRTRCYLVATLDKEMG
jgi:antitoxin (DNA-binding transcriptional repressor) of toxin-antitoxin stability system